MSNPKVKLVLEDLLITELECVRLGLVQTICQIDKSVERIERIKKLKKRGKK